MVDMSRSLFLDEQLVNEHTLHLAVTHLYPLRMVLLGFLGFIQIGWEISDRKLSSALRWLTCRTSTHCHLHGEVQGSMGTW